MKKIIIIGLLFLISACSNSNEDSSNDTDSIIGTWELIKISNVCSSGFEDDYEFTNCEARNIIFTANGSIRSTSPNCISDNPSPSNGWYSINDTTLIITWQVDVTDNITEKWDNFELYSDKLKLTQSNKPIADITCPDGGIWSYQYHEYVRVK